MVLKASRRMPLKYYGAIIRRLESAGVYTAHEGITERGAFSKSRKARPRRIHKRQ